MTDLTLWRKQEIDKLKRELDQLFRQFRRGFGVSRAMLETDDIFAVQLSETEKTVVVKADFPGMAAEDIRVSVTDDTLIITGGSSEERVRKGESYDHLEKRTRNLTRTLSMPCRIDTGGVKASFKEGILTIELPKCDPPKPRGIKVNSQ